MMLPMTHITPRPVLRPGGRGGNRPSGFCTSNHDSETMIKPTLVGINFRKGAKEAIAMMRAARTPVIVILMREPTNAHDRNAVRVFCRLSDFTEIEVAMLRKAGATTIFGNLLMLGYVDRHNAVDLARQLDQRRGGMQPPKAILDLNETPPTLSPLIE